MRSIHFFVIKTILLVWSQDSYPLNSSIEFTNLDHFCLVFERIRVLNKKYSSIEGIRQGKRWGESKLGGLNQLC